MNESAHDIMANDGDSWLTLCNQKKAVGSLVQPCVISDSTDGRTNRKERRRAMGGTCQFMFYMQF